MFYTRISSILYKRLVIYLKKKKMFIQSNWTWRFFFSLIKILVLRRRNSIDRIVLRPSPYRVIYHTAHVQHRSFIFRKLFLKSIMSFGIVLISFERSNGWLRYIVYGVFSRANEVLLAILIDAVREKCETFVSSSHFLRRSSAWLFGADIFFVRCRRRRSVSTPDASV